MAKKDFRQPAFLFLKAVFVFGRSDGRRSRRDSGLSFRLLIRMRSSHAGGDPFSHPSGSSVPRPIRVTDQSAKCRRASALSARPPPGEPGARKHSVPSRVHSVSDDVWLASPCGGTSNLSLTHGLVESPKFRLRPLPPRRVWGAGGDPPCPFSSVGSGVQTPSLVHDRSPRNHGSFLARTRARRRRARRRP